MRITLNALCDEFPDIDTDDLKRVYKLVKGKVEPNREVTDEHYRPFNPYSDFDYRMFEIDKLLQGNDVEYIEHVDDGFNFGSVQGISFSNMGDPYSATIMYDHCRDHWILGGIGDVIEKNNKLK